MQLDSQRPSAWNTAYALVYVAVCNFLEVNDLNDPARIWNANETGCQLCQKSGKFLALSGAKYVYHVTSDTKEQITTLCAISAAENIISHMHIFFPTRDFGQIRLWLCHRSILWQVRKELDYQGAVLRLVSQSLYLSYPSELTCCFAC